MNPGFESLIVGRVLADRYEVRSPLARGGMSVILLGFDRTLGRDVAVKVVALAGHASEEHLPLLRERFRREAGSAARIQHPNVVQVFDYGTDAELGLDFIIMELLRGRDLKGALAGGGLPRPVAIRVIVEAARGVAAGHRSGVIHRDVKPANVFLLGDGDVEGVKVLDFGIARAMEEDPDGGLTVLGAVPHSPAYASPEQLEPGAALTPASDVYQLGLLAYEALAARRAYEPEDRTRIRAGERVELPETVAWARTGAALREVVGRALEPDPARRFEDAARFAAAVEDAVRADEASPAPDAQQDDPDETSLLAAAPGAGVTPPSMARTPDGAAALARIRQGGAIVWIVPLLLLLALAVWAARRGAEGGSVPLAGTEAAADTGALPEPTPVEEIDAIAEVQGELTEAVHDLNRAWIEGDIPRHVRHYASRVDYYNSSRLPVSGVRRDRTRDLNRYDDRRIGIHDVRVEMLEDGRARVLVDKEWYFAGDGRTRQGRGTQEYLFRRDRGDGRWYVVSEQLLTTNERRSGARD
jgi:hypothetical protein